MNDLQTTICIIWWRRQRAKRVEIVEVASSLFTNEVIVLCAVFSFPSLCLIGHQQAISISRSVNRIVDKRLKCLPKKIY